MIKPITVLSPEEIDPVARDAVSQIIRSGSSSTEIAHTVLTLCAQYPLLLEVVRCADEICFDDLQDGKPDPNYTKLRLALDALDVESADV